MSSSGRIKKKILIIIVVCVVATVFVFVLFLRKYTYLDGGTTGYRGFMYLYSIENRLEFVVVDGNNYYNDGIVISVLGIKIYDETSVDFSQKAADEHTPEVESLREEIESAMSSNSN